MIFTQFFGSNFPICLTILRTPIPTIFLLGFPTWGSHSHFVEIRYTISGSIERSIVCSCSPLHSSPYNNSPPYLCFPFFGEWYTYGRSRISCGSCVFTIMRRIINIKTFNVINEVCRLDHFISFPLGFLIPIWFLTTSSALQNILFIQKKKLCLVK